MLFLASFLDFTPSVGVHPSGVLLFVVLWSGGAGGGLHPESRDWMFNFALLPIFHLWSVRGLIYSQSNQFKS